MAQQIKAFPKAMVWWLLVALLFALVIPLLSPKVYNAKSINSADMTMADVTLPYYVNSPSGREVRTYAYTMTVHYARHQSSVLNFAADDCLASLMINNRALPLSPSTMSGCNPAKPSYIDVSAYLKPGENQIALTVADSEFTHGIDVHAAVWGGPFTLITPFFIGLVICLMGAYSTLLAGGRESAVTIALFVFGASLAVWFGWHTGYMEYGNDLLGHRDYMLYIINHHELPRPMDGWVYYHPPLYYLVGAFCILLEQKTQSIDAFVLLRLFNLCCYMAFLYYGIAFFRRHIPSRSAYLLVTTLYVTFPGLIVTSVRIEPHTLLYALWAAAIYYTALWVEQKRNADLVKALVVIAVGILTRSNMLVMLATLGLTVLMELLFKTISLRAVLNRKVWIGGVIVLLALIGNFGDTLYYKAIGQSGQTLMVGNAGQLDGGGLMLEKNYTYYVTMDVWRYIASPFYRTFGHTPDRQYLWAAALKSSMFGEYVMFPEKLASVMNALLLLIWASMLYGIVAMKREEYKKQRFYLLALFMFFFSMAANRALHPYAPTQDFRYVMPLMILVLYGFGLALMRIHAKTSGTLLYQMVNGLILSFVAMGAIFYPLNIWITNESLKIMNMQSPPSTAKVETYLPPSLTDEGTMRVPNSR